MIRKLWPLVLVALLGLGGCAAGGDMDSGDTMGDEEEDYESGY